MKVAVVNSQLRDENVYRTIIEKDMDSASLFDEQEQVTRTNLVDIMSNALEASMTVRFNKKVDVNDVKETLAAVLKNKKNLKDAKTRKEIAKTISTGKEVSMTCYLTNSVGHLGRASAIDLNAHPKTAFRQIDFRTVQSVVLKNKKYIVKK